MNWKEIECTGDVPKSRDKHTLTCIGRDQYLLFGGHNFDQYFSEVHILDVHTQKWILPEIRGRHRPMARDGHTTIEIGDGRILLWGGSSGGENFLKDLWTMDPREMRWRKQEVKGKTPGPRSGHSMDLVDGRIFVFGGLGIGENFYDDLSMLSIGDDVDKFVKKEEGAIGLMKQGEERINHMQIKRSERNNYSKRFSKENYTSSGDEWNTNKKNQYNSESLKTKMLFNQTITTTYIKNPEITSKLYYEENILNFNDIITDGFYDGGRGSSFSSLEKFEEQTISTNDREVLVINAKLDKALENFRNNTVYLLCSISEVRDRILLLSLIVSDFFGGSHNPKIIGLSLNNIGELKESLESNVIPIGHINFGLCRHRAIMFKYLADCHNFIEKDKHLKIPCKLVRGVYAKNNEAEQIGGHVWNIVRLSGNDYVIDVMFEPTILQNRKGWRASKYFRIKREENRVVIAGGSGASLKIDSSIELQKGLTQKKKELERKKKKVKKQRKKKNNKENKNYTLQKKKANFPIGTNKTQKDKKKNLNLKNNLSSKKRKAKTKKKKKNVDFSASNSENLSRSSRSDSGVGFEMKLGSESGFESKSGSGSGSGSEPESGSRSGSFSEQKSFEEQIHQEDKKKKKRYKDKKKKKSKSKLEVSNSELESNSENGNDNDDNNQNNNNNNNENISDNDDQDDDGDSNNANDQIMKKKLKKGKRKNKSKKKHRNKKRSKSDRSVLETEKQKKNEEIGIKTEINNIEEKTNVRSTKFNENNHDDDNNIRDDDDDDDDNDDDEESGRGSGDDEGQDIDDNEEMVSSKQSQNKKKSKKRRHSHTKSKNNNKDNSTEKDRIGKSSTFSNIINSKSKSKKSQSSRKSHSRSKYSLDLKGGFNAKTQEGKITWKISVDELHRINILGVGSIGVVYRSKWLGINVAQKTLFIQDFDEQFMETLKREVSIMSEMRHPNIVQFLGACFEKPNISLVHEFLPKKTLRNVLRDPKFVIDANLAINWAIQIAKGMHFLHHKNVLHGDLKTENILVANDLSLKISDFGLELVKQKTSSITNRGMGSPVFLSPEKLKNEKITKKSDVYSFSIILWEITTRELPFKDLNPIQTALAIVNNQARPDIPQSCPKSLAKLMKECWNEEPKKRPNFEHLYKRLTKISDEIKTMHKKKSKK
ncbi:serine/threonine-protein kinase edr1 [Anaeramoeba flamelloides]|uniref:Serine/threonine-protein kinase edr1 n=1 Tax=Anaeramoeba flamelloides TaxID=1746091 RepID=A0AAV7ZS83_9EUKA|nr:serine/threonine-protein kinase edr1 [Anaeramoeba flamelloides]